MKSGVAKKSWIFLACFFAVAGLSYGIFKSGILKDKAFTLPAISKFVKSAKQPDKEQHTVAKLPLPVKEEEEPVKQPLPEAKESVAVEQPFSAEEKVVSEVEADVPLEKETEIPELTLEGIIGGSGRPMVIINDIILSEGDTIEGAKVIKVEGDSVILMHDQKEFSLSLK